MVTDGRSCIAAVVYCHDMALDRKTLADIASALFISSQPYCFKKERKQSPANTNCFHPINSPLLISSQLYIPL